MTDDLFSYAKRVHFLDMSDQDLSDLKRGVREVWMLMKDGEWHSPETIITVSGGREGLRRMRELRHYGLEVEKRRRPETRYWEYRITKIK